MFGRVLYATDYLPQGSLWRVDTGLNETLKGWKLSENKPLIQMPNNSKTNGKHHDWFNHLAIEGHLGCFWLFYIIHILAWIIACIIYFIYFQLINLFAKYYQIIIHSCANYILTSNMISVFLYSSTLIKIKLFYFCQLSALKMLYLWNSISFSSFLGWDWTCFHNVVICIFFYVYSLLVILFPLFC